MKRRILDRNKNIILILLVMLASFVMPVYVLAEDNNVAEAPLRVDLSYSGGDAPEETFRIHISSVGDAPLPVEGEELSLALSDHNPSGSVSFTFRFNKEGVYSYRISEQAGRAEGVRYDESVYTDTIEVYREGGNLRCSMRVSKEGVISAKPSAISFANVYSATGIVMGDPPIKIQKSISGDKPKEETEFVFIMKPVTAGAPLPNGTVGDYASVTIVGEGEVEIGNITFTKAGIYEYIISEKDDKVAGYSYDDANFRVVYTVTESSSGALSCDRTMLKNNYETVSECRFTNEYTDDAPDDKETPDVGTKPGSPTDKGTPTPSVKTGDDINSAIWVALLTMSLCLLISAALKKRRKHE